MSWRHKVTVVEPERIVLDEETKAWYREIITVENPLAALYSEVLPGFFPDERQPRFFTLQCQHCKGVHTGACPRVKVLKLYESGAIREVEFHEHYDDSAIIWMEDVFGDEPADTIPAGGR